MFRKTQPKQLGVFSEPSSYLSKRMKKVLTDKRSWHNVFYKEVTSVIDEEIFIKLYDEGNGRPNVSIRVMVAMMILKESEGWTDRQLFYECQMNLGVRRALGLLSLDDEIPADETYYNFRRKLKLHLEREQEDLLKQCFQQVTMEQMKTHGVSGKKIRLDSKLLNSNIATSTRIELIVEAIRVFIKEIDPSKPDLKIKKRHRDFLIELKSKTTSNVLYGKTNKQKEQLLEQSGYIIRELLKQDKDNKQYDLLFRLYKEQYEENNSKDSNKKGDDNDSSTPKLRGKLRVKPSGEVPSDSIQSIHDPQASYRKKGQQKPQKVKGYHANIAESCDEDNEMNLLVDYDLKGAHESEANFLEDCICNSEKVIAGSETTERIEQAITDGGYDNKANRQRMSQPDQPSWQMTKLKGGKRRYQIKKKEDGYEVYDRKTNTRSKVDCIKKIGKWKITNTDNTHRYMTDEQIDQYALCNQLEKDLEPGNANLRANVEATINQVFSKSGPKTRYRGRAKHAFYLASACLATNFKRIWKKIAEKIAFLPKFGSVNTGKLRENLMIEFLFFEILVGNKKFIN